MKKTLSIILAVVLMVAVMPLGAITASAATIGYSTSYDALTGGMIIHSAQGDISGDFEIPSILFGDTVTGIGSGAFENCWEITSITIPDTVISIGDEAFRSCENLKSVIIPDGVTSIGSYAFANCTSLANISLPNNGMEIGYRSFYDTAYYKNSGNWKNGVLYIGSHCIDSKDTISESYTVKNGTKSIGENALAYVMDLVNITLPDSVEVIATDAFRSSYNLQNITIGSGVSSIGSAFEHCKSLQNINVSFENEFFSSEEGVLFDKTKVKLLCYPNGKNEKLYIIPNTVNTIVSHAFYNNSYLSEITIPTSVSIIESDAFKFSFEKVYYRGSQSEKNSIWMGYSINLLNATWYYNSCLGSSTHKYDNACDNECNVCFDLRTPPHNFKWVIDLKESCVLNGIKHEECSICHTKRNENTIIDGTNSHVYINACDDTCEVCKKSRSAPHYYEWVIDKKEKCNEIGIKHEECTVCHIKRNENTIIETKPHTYENICDFDCNMCGFIREVPEHSYGTDLTCDICKYSKTPDLPILEVVLADIIKLQSVIGCEYSKDGINWQTSPEFSGLKPGTEYTFYQRVAKSVNSYVSEVSTGLTVKTQNGFTITYDANGGTNAPDSHIKTEGVTLAISSLKPIRDGYEFMGWATVLGGDVIYDSGDNYINDETVTLYAKWLKICAKCFGNGEIQKQYICGSCSGTGSKYSSHDCPSCIRGVTTTETSCPACVGGYIIAGSATIRCTSCGGDGSLTLPSTCSNCGGSGTLYYFLGYCSSCGGAGYEYETYTCNTCAGAGSINELDRIEITQLPEKVSFLEGKETLSVVGGIITLFYSNNTNQTIDITPSMVTGFDNTVVGIQTLTVTYKNKAVTYDIEVKAKSVISIELIDNGLKKKYFENKDALDILGGMVRVQYNNDTYNDIILTENMINGFDNTIVGFQTLTVTYENKTVTYDIEIIKDYTPGDIDGVKGVTDADAEYMLMHTFFPEDYPVNQSCDFNGDGKVNDADAEYLLMFTVSPKDYPLMPTSLPATTTGSCSINGNSSVTVGSNIEFIIDVSGCVDATSIAVAIDHSDDFEFVSGTWLKTGSIIKFDTATNKGALGVLSSPDVNGNLFKVVLKAKTVSPSDQNVSVNIIAKNGSTEIMNVISSKGVKIDCVTHSYGTYENKDTNNHNRTCTVCGNVESRAHALYVEIANNTAIKKCIDCGYEEYISDGWLQNDSNWMFFVNGQKATGWRFIDANWYYFDLDGKMQTGWLLDGVWYYLADNGAMMTGWQNLGGTWYYFNQSGAMQTGWLLDGVWYYLADNGAMVDGWQYIGNTWYYFSGGAMQTGWLNQGGTWYYLADGGNMVTGWQYIGSSWYYFHDGGNMATGWLLDGNTWYYLSSGGNMVTDWQLIGGTWYYFNSSGAWVG